MERRAGVVKKLRNKEVFHVSKIWGHNDCSLHHFSDASQERYGQVPYLRLVGGSETVQ